MAGIGDTSDRLTLLTPDRPEVRFPALDVIVYGRVFPTKRAPESPLAGFHIGEQPLPRWRVGMVHGALLIPGVVERDDVIFTDAEIASSGARLPGARPLALLQGGEGRRNDRAYAARLSGRGRPGRGGQVLIVSLEEWAASGGSAGATPVGRTRFQRLTWTPPIVSQEGLVRRLRRSRIPTSCAGAAHRCARTRSNIHEDELERQIGSSFLRFPASETRRSRR